MKHGNFSDLSDFYAKYRPGYCPMVLDAVLGLSAKQPTDIDFVDVGAGTGIWSRQVAAAGCKVIAVEPNDSMRQKGITASGNDNILWKNGSGENTGLDSASADFVSMASSFHWTDFDVAIREFARLIRPGGFFVALWNPRYLAPNAMLVEIEEFLKNLVPELNRVSSGNSVFCDGLLDRLETVDSFGDVIYVEGRHIEKQSKQHYLGLWKSVNDIRVQAGEERFEKFLAYIDDRIGEDDIIEASYRTRAWIARRK